LQNRVETVTHRRYTVMRFQEAARTVSHDVSLGRQLAAHERAPASQKPASDAADTVDTISSSSSGISSAGQGQAPAGARQVAVHASKACFVNRQHSGSWNSGLRITSRRSSKGDVSPSDAMPAVRESGEWMPRRSGGPLRSMCAVVASAALERGRQRDLARQSSNTADDDTSEVVRPGAALPPPSPAPRRASAPRERPTFGRLTEMTASTGDVHQGLCVCAPPSNGGLAHVGGGLHGAGVRHAPPHDHGNGGGHGAGRQAHADGHDVWRLEGVVQVAEHAAFEVVHHAETVVHNAETSARRMVAAAEHSAHEMAHEAGRLASHADGLLHDTVSAAGGALHKLERSMSSKSVHKLGSHGDGGTQHASETASSTQPPGPGRV